MQEKISYPLKIITQEKGPSVLNTRSWVLDGEN